MASRVSVVDDSPRRKEWRSQVDAICRLSNYTLYPDSVTAHGDWDVALVRRGDKRNLLVSTEDEVRIADFRGTDQSRNGSARAGHVRLCPLTFDNAQALRKHVPSLAPSVPGTGISYGTGDRLGLATPGHIRALCARGLQPVLAQQSIREMVRTQRAPREVVDDAMWGVLEAGFTGPYGADADHLKTTEHLVQALDAGFTMYTADPGDCVDNTVGHATASDLVERVARLPWDELESTPDECRRRYAGRTVVVAGSRVELRLTINETDALRAAAKYGRAIGHTMKLYRFLLANRPRDQFAFEVTVDETDAPTSAIEHFYVASELRRLGAHWDSLAPRFVGRFCKGTEYIGDLAAFRSTLREHVAIAERFGGYKISLHSGSDKFSLYPIMAEEAGDLIHVKTAGTSYLEALRVIARHAPDLFREILAFAVEQFRQDQREYCVDADPARVPDPRSLADAQLPDILNQLDTRQVCHVTYGSVLTSRDEHGRPLYRDRVFTLLRSHEQAYYHQLEQHFERHFRPFD